MEHQIAAIEWALNEAREELRKTGKTYREHGPWSFDPTGKQRREAYEGACKKLRKNITGLEQAAETIRATHRFVGAA